MQEFSDIQIPEPSYIEVLKELDKASTHFFEVSWNLYLLVDKKVRKAKI